MLDFSVSIAISYFFYQLLATCLATFAFRNEWILEKMKKKGWITDQLEGAINMEDDTHALAHAGIEALQHSEATKGGWWTKVVSSGVCPLGKFGYWWFVFWVLLSSSLMFVYMHHSYDVRKKLYWGLFGGTIATAVVILILTFWLNRPLFVRSIPFLIIQAGALAILVAGVAGECRSNAADSAVTS